MTGITVTVRPKSPVLARYVAALWYQLVDESAARRERVVPTGAAGLHIALDGTRITAVGPGGSEAAVTGAALQGPLSRPQIITPHQLRHSVGVAFRPGGLYPFVDLPVTELTNTLVPARQLWGDDAARLADRLAVEEPRRALDRLEDALLAWLRRTGWRALSTATGLLAHNVSVSALGEEYGWTGNRLRRTFSEQVGLTPKLYGRLGRFQRMLARAAAAPVDDWARLAAEYGYSDQPHLIHEFQGFAGVNPGAYRPVSPSARNHIGLSEES